MITNEDKFDRKICDFLWVYNTYKIDTEKNPMPFNYWYRKYYDKRPFFKKYKNYIIGIFYIYASVFSSVLLFSSIDNLQVVENLILLLIVIFNNSTVFLLGTNILFKELK